MEQQQIPIRSSPPAQERYVGQGIADPSPIRHGGQLHVFATSRGNIVHLTGEPLTPFQSLHGATVPFAVEVEGQLMVLAQRNTGGRRQPVLSRVELQTPNTRPSWRPLLKGLEEVGTCTSPVLGPHPHGGWLMLCVEEREPTGYAP